MFDVKVDFEETGNDPFRGRLAGIVETKLARKITDSIMEEFIASASDFRNEMIQSMEHSPKTGRRYLRTKDNRWHTASSPYNPPRPDSGDLIRSLAEIDIRTEDMEVEVGSDITDPPYPFYLEEGTVKMRPRPFIGPALEKILPPMESNIAIAIARSTGGK